jgi:PKD repeat protein
MRKYIVRFCLIFAFVNFLSIDLLAQNSCGTTISDEEMIELESLLARAQRSNLQSVAVEIPIKFHSVRRSDGSGGLTASQKDDLIEQVNAFYVNSNISFFHVDEINYIDSDDAYNLDSSSEGLVTSGNTLSGTINVFFTGSLSSGGTPVCGYTRFPPSADHIFVAYGCVSNGNSTLEHELGHYFTLFHTHGTTNVGTTDELVNGSNCQAAGDRLCDTPADPNLSGVVNNDCAYVGNATDANGDFYRPNVANIMSYSIDRCQDLFSPQQYSRIRNGFENGRGYLNFRTDNFIATVSLEQTEACILADVIYNGNSFGASEWLWEFEGGTPSTSTAQNPSVYYENAGDFDVTLTVTSNAGESFSLTRNRIITVIDPLENSTNDSIVFSDSKVEAFSELFNVRNVDKAFTFELTDVVIEGSTVPLIKMNNFDYVTETPGLVDVLESLYLDNLGVNSYQIEIDYAYAFRSGSVKDGEILSARSDTLSVLLENECGITPIVLDKIGGDALATVEAMSERYVPTALADFATYSFTYPVNAGEEFARVLIQNVSYNGNNLYIKGIRIKQDFSLASPANFRFVRIEEESLLFRWLDNSTNEIAFVMEGSVNGVDFISQYDIPAGSQGYNLPKIDAGENRYFRLKAVGVKGFESAYSDIYEIEPSVLSTSELYRNKLSLFPNPAANNLVIDIDGTLLGNDIRYEVISITGEALQEGIINNVKNNIDLSAFNSGIIFVRIYDNKNLFSITKKIIKL